MKKVLKAKAIKLRRAVLLWYARHKRDLPWRRTTDPWKVLVSETMLQQTQVERVVPKYLAFTQRWPTARDFSAAPVADAISAWSGLGYNRRAVFLHRAAGVVAERHGGEVPTTTEELVALPGVGAYTAGAVAAFAGNADVVLWDTNVRRIALRAFHGGEFARRIPSDDALREALGAALPKGRAREWYNALMDLGSGVCTSRRPKCEACPLRASCAAAPRFLAGDAPKRKLIRPQAAFAGSVRQARGEALRAVAGAGGSMARIGLLTVLGEVRSVQPTTAEAAIAGLIKDGLLTEKGRRVALP